MSDILFRYLLMARRRDRSVFRRLFFADEQLLEAGVEQLVESAAAKIAVTSQHERVGTEKVTVPASRRHSVRFYEAAEPRRPTPGQFEERSQEFPLQGSLKVYTCTRCHGSGEVRCAKCRGRGRMSCRICGGSGRSRGGSRRRRCGHCGGAGQSMCSRCHGSGWESCHRCRGEGQLASWEKEIYRWLIERRSQEAYPLEKCPSRLRRAFARWLKIDSDLVADLEPATVAGHLGFETAEALAVAAKADALRLRLEGEARQSSDRHLFHRSDCSLSPVGYTVVRLAGSARTYWLVGRGEKAVGVRPRGRPDGLKLWGWLGLGASGAMSWEGAVRGVEYATLQVLDALQILAGLPDPWIAGGWAASSLLVTAAVRRVTRRERPVRTVALLPASGEPTPWLTCLAYLGSYTQRLRVLDRTYDTQLERLLGKMRPARQSESLTVELDDGRWIRMVEVANPSQRSDAQLSLMLQALDGVVVVADGRAADGRAADDLEVRLRKLARATYCTSDRPRTAASRTDGDTLRIGVVAVDRTDAGLAAAEAIPLEAIRRAFVTGAEADWDALFEQLWRPMDGLPAIYGPVEGLRLPPEPAPEPAPERAALEISAGVAAGERAEVPVSPLPPRRAGRVAET